MRKVVYVNLSNLNQLTSLPKDTRIRAYKYVTEERKSDIYPVKDITYNDGKVVQVRKYNTDRNESCGHGLNVATFNWCRGDCTDYGKKYKKLIVVEFQPRDIVCIPHHSFGKFRVKKLKVLYARRWK